MDENIVKLRAELKAKEAELNEALLVRGDKTQSLSNISQEFEARGYSLSYLFLYSKYRGY